MGIDAGGGQVQAQPGVQLADPGHRQDGIQTQGQEAAAFADLRRVQQQFFGQGLPQGPMHGFPPQGGRRSRGRSRR